MSLSYKQKKEVGDKCVADELFNIPYIARVPYQAAVSMEEMLTFGLTGFYDKKQLEAELNNPIVVRVTIAQMAELIAQGYSVSLVDMSDCTPIFKVITQHLKNWKQVINTYTNTCNPPFQDLILLDSVAGMLYPFIPKEEVSNNRMSNILTGAIAGFDFVNPNNLLTKPVKPQFYNSYANFFIDQMYKFHEYN